MNRPSLRSPWRALSIAVVAVLAIGIGVAAGSFLLAKRAHLGPAAAYVPADVPLYVELRVEPSAAQDAALRALLARFGPIEGLDPDRPLYEQITQRLDDALAEEGIELTWTADVAPWFDGRLAIAVSRIDAGSLGAGLGDMSGEHALGTPVPATMLLGVSDPAVADAAITRILAATDAPDFSETQHAGVTIHVSAGEEPAAFALTDDQLIIGSDQAAVTELLDAHADPAGTLSGAQGIAAMAAALPPDLLVFAAFNSEAAFDTGFGSAGATDPMLDALRSVLEHQPKRGVLAISVEGDRVLIDSASEAPTGPLALDNADRGLAADVPGSALFYSELVNVGSALSGLIQPIIDSMGAEAGPTHAPSMPGVPVVSEITDMVSWIDDAALVAGSDAGVPFAGLVITPDSSETAERQLSQLRAFIGLAALDPDSPVSVTTADVEGVEVTTVRLAGAPEMADAPIDVPSDLVIEWAVTPNRVLVGLGDSFVRDSLGLAEGDSLAAQSRFADAVAHLGGSSNAGVAWVDLDGVIDLVGGLDGPLPLPGDGATDVLGPLDRFASVSRIEGGLLVVHSAVLFD